QEDQFVLGASDRSENSRFSPRMELQSLDVFRPLPEKPLEPIIAEAQRQEFFNQLHRWLRQDYAVHVFCNNDGERHRFEEIWDEYGLGSPESPQLHLGPLARG